jgi:hypothetical protein
MNSKLLCLLLVCYCITADQHFILGWFSVTVDLIFKIIQLSNDNSHHFLTSIKIYSHSRIQNNQSTNFQNYTSALTQISEKGCFTASKLIKESEKRRFIVKKLLLFLWFVYSICVPLLRKAFTSIAIYKVILLYF